MTGWAIRAGKPRQVVAALIVAIAAIPVAAHAEGRVALVVGNAAYSTGVGPLANPVKDAALIADALTARQFVVTRAANLDRVRLLAAVDAYARKLAAAGPGAVGFIYYSGHGAANPDNGRNYLIPVDAQSASDSTLWYQSVPLQEIVETISKIAPQAANVVVFDACREELRLPGGKTLGDGGKGLSREVARPSVLIAFSTSPDAIAADLDRSAATGPYATELAAALAKPGVDLETMFSDVKYAVLMRTGQKQLPYIDNGLRARVVLNGGVAPQAARMDPYARWGLTKRDFDVVGIAQLLGKAQARDRFSELTEAASAGDAVAQTLVGLGYDLGIGAAQNFPEAMRWYRKAADSGQPRAMHNIGYLYDNGLGVKQDHVEAMRWYRKAVDLGSPFSMKNIGLLYANGHGVSQDYVEAMRWYRKAADGGDVSAMTNIGFLYDKGHSVTQDYAEAMRWYRKAADGGEPGGMANIGVLFRDGIGVTQDYAEAMRWFRKAADLGGSAGMANVGVLFRDGNGVTQDYAEAMRWFRKAADLGEPSGMANVGYFYANGLGVKKDIAEARRWYEKAAASGFEDAKRLLKDLREQDDLEALLL